MPDGGTPMPRDVFADLVASVKPTKVKLTLPTDERGRVKAWTDASFEVECEPLVMSEEADAARLAAKFLATLRIISVSDKRCRNGSDMILEMEMVRVTS